MGKKSELAERLLLCHQRNAVTPSHAPRCFIGFDGFTDEILTAVESRKDADTFKPFQHIADFGSRIMKASGKSGNIELVFQQKKLGGNAPILTNALLEGGHRITFAGAIGSTHDIEAIFHEMASRCEKVIPLGPSGHSDAIEFEDGKIILGKLENLKNVNYEELLRHIDRTSLIQLLEETDLFVCANWTMLPMMTDMWKKIYEEICPHLTDRPRWMFVDLADPAKRSDEDLKEALEALARFGSTHRVILGLNKAEAFRIAQVLSVPASNTTTDNIEKLAKNIQQASHLYQVVIHTTTFASAANDHGTASALGIQCPHPVLTTGGGDNFNAGFCNALLCDLSEEETLLSGVATSGYYVSRGKSPTVPELAEFLREWDEKEQGDRPCHASNIT